MTRIYLYFNAALYLLFAIWCTLAAADTAARIGYVVLSPSGLSEFLVVYGGMELGFAAFFAWCARRAERAGLLFALCLYAPVVIWRWSSVAAAHGPISSTTLATGALETTLLLAALALWRRAARADSRQNRSH
ncbi:MAG: DUF4345 domain-containing protein [Gammaproteobacteria bacterium]|nr:MAG: DUF4345 domain-containing protein [Gammaproteobacteria bacterium]